MRNPIGHRRRPRRTRARRLYGLAHARMRAGMSGAELSRRSGVSKASISRLEWGDVRASPQTALKLARALGVDPNALIRRPGEEER